MRFSRLAAAFCGVAMVSGSAQAALTFSTQRSAVNGTLDRVVLYALSDGPNVLGGDLTVSTPTANGLKFSVTDTDDDQIPDTVNAFTSAVTTATRTRADSQVFSIIANTAPDPRASDAASTFTPGLSSWQIAAAASNNGAGYAADSSLNGGKGYAVFAAVVPTGSDVSFNGSVGDTNLGSFNVALTDTSSPVPEPVGLAFIGLGTVGLVGRRSRRA
jgi:hypothetical protein